jgi:hypothetical protein
VASTGAAFGGIHAGHAGHGAAGRQLDDSAVIAAGAVEGVGNEVQAASDDASRILPNTERAGWTMWVVFLEMGVALGLLLLIVWWTWPKKRPQDEDKK